MVGIVNSVEECYYMVQIISDSSTLYSIAEAKEIGLISCPLNVSINGNVYREFEEMDSATFVKLVRDGGIPKTSQPSIGEKVEAYQSIDPDTEIIDITMAHGLSGTYHSALCAKEMCENSANIHVVNSTTLCAPQRYIVNEALKMAHDGLDAKTILEKIDIAIHNGGSFLLPSDFDFLKRGGRLNTVAATIGGLMKIVPLMLLSDDGTTILKYSVQKTAKKAVEKIVEYLHSKGVNSDFYIAVSHADNLEVATKIKERIEEALNVQVELFDLSPAFIAQGGPSCVAVQWCHKINY